MERASLGDRWAFGPNSPSGIRRHRSSLLATAVSLFMVLGVTAALADNTVPDGDNVAPVSANALALGTVCVDSTASGSALIGITRNGNYTNANVFKKGTTATVSVLSQSAGLSATVGPPNTINIPSNWDTASNGVVAGPVSASITLTAGSTAGSFAGSIVFRSSGTESDDTSLTRDGTLSVTATISDSGDCATASDTTPPVVTVPANITAEATSSLGAVVSYPAATATDDVDGSVAVTCSPASGSTFAIGTTTVNCSAMDDAGNTGYGSFTVTVVDTTPPVVTVPANITAEATSSLGAVVSYPAATATDDVDGSVAVTCSPASGSTFAIGTTTVNCSAMDEAGNTGYGSFTVTVVDTTPPTLSLPDNITGVVATGQSGAVVTYSASAADIVDGSVAVTCSPASGSTFAIGTTTVDCSAMDDAGNTANGSFTVGVIYGQDGQGIRQPINIDNTSLFSRGRAVPVKFGLLNDAPTGFSTSGWSVKAGTVSCSVFDTEDATLEAVQAVQPGGAIRYDSTSDQYIYNADFRTKPVGTCWRVFVEFDDGTKLGSATFKLTK